MESQANIELRYEVSIIWINPAAKNLKYLRECTLMSGRRKSVNIKKFRVNIVAYAVLLPDAPNCGIRGRFKHRVWYLKKHDPYKDQGHPLNAVIPSSIMAGKETLKVGNCDASNL